MTRPADLDQAPKRYWCKSITVATCGRDAPEQCFTQTVPECKTHLHLFPAVLGLDNKESLLDGRDPCGYVNANSYDREGRQREVATLLSPS